MIKNKVVIAGVGATTFSKCSGKTELEMAVEASNFALKDAGIDSNSVDGVVTLVMDNTPEIEVFRCVGGQNLSFFSRVDYGGGGGCGAITQAVLALSAGLCNTVLVYRSMNERSNYRFGDGQMINQMDPLSFVTVDYSSWYLPHGLRSPAAFLALNARRYMHQYGASSVDFGRVSVSARNYAASNPAAHFYQRPITLEDHQASPMIADPLRLFDCCQESDGAVAFILTRSDRVAELNNKPVYVKACAQAATRDTRLMTDYYSDNIAFLNDKAFLAKALFDQSGLTASDIQSAILYDHFTPYVLMQLEAMGFCPVGEAKNFVKDGHLELNGLLPTNTHGGQIGEAYIHGMNGVAESVRQLRGTAVNQVESVANMLVTSGDGLPTSGLILGNNQSY